MSSGGLLKKGRTLPDPATLPAASRVPIVAAAQAYSEAVVAVTVPAIARVRTDRADELQRTIPISLIESGLVQVLPVIEGAMATPEDRRASGLDYEPQELAGWIDGRLLELGWLRTQMAKNPAKANQLLQLVGGMADDLQFELTIIAQLEALDALWAAIQKSETFWKSSDLQNQGDNLEDKGNEFYAEFTENVYKLYIQGGEHEKKTARDNYRKLVERDEFKQYQKAVIQHLKDDARRKRFVKFVVAIGIAVVAFGLGQVALGYALAKGSSVLGRPSSRPSSRRGRVCCSTS